VVYPPKLDLLPSYENWLPKALFSTKENGENIDPNITNLPPLCMNAFTTP
jgi:hypothetical protein